MKTYSENAAETTVNSVVGNLDRVNPTLIETIKLYLQLCKTEDVNYFIKTFNEIIKKTHEQFLTIKPSIRKYYIEFFTQKLDKIYHKRMDKISDNDFKSYSNCLYEAFKKSVIKNEYKYDVNFIEPPEIPEEIIKRKQLLDNEFNKNLGIPNDKTSISNECEKFEQENITTTEPDTKEVNINLSNENITGTIEIQNKNTTVSDNTIERKRKIITKNFIQDNSGW